MHRSHRCTAACACCRWDHDVKGADSPLAFEDFRISETGGGPQEVSLTGRKGSGKKHVELKFTATIVEGRPEPAAADAEAGAIESTLSV